MFFIFMLNALHQKKYTNNAQVSIIRDMPGKELYNFLVYIISWLIQLFITYSY